MTRATAALGIVVFFSLFGRPAFAGVTGAVLAANPPQYAGRCPATIHFAGAVLGSAGTIFRYQFVRSDSSTSQLSPQITMGPAGKYAVGENLSVSTSSPNPLPWDAVQVTWGNSQPLRSPLATYAVSCSSNLGGLNHPPGAALGGTTGGSVPLPVPSRTYLAPPTNLRTTNDLATCRDAAGGGWAGFACAAWMNSSAYVLLWDWTNAPCPQYRACPKSIDGFQVYDAGTGKPLGNIAKVRVQGFLPNAGSSNGCYYVRARNGDDQGAPSATLCVNAGMASTPKQIGNQYKTLEPTYSQTSYVQWANATGVLGGGHANDRKSSSNVVQVGFVYTTVVNNSGDVGWIELWRGAVYFDLSSISGRTLRNATLNLHVGSSVIGNMQQPNGNASCIGKVGFGQKDWWDYTDWIEGNWFADVGRSAGPNVSLDVTKQVQQWLAGSANYGFVFRGEDENLHAFTENSCRTHYDSVTLNVTYF